MKSCAVLFTMALALVPVAIRAAEPMPPLASPAPDPIRQREMQVHFLIGSEYFKEGNYNAAIAEWKEVLKIEPDHALAKEKIKRAKEKLAER